MKRTGEARIPWDDLKAVIFDMDGVVTDTASTHAKAWKRLFDEYLEERSRRGGGGGVRALRYRLRLPPIRGREAALRRG